MDVLPPGKLYFRMGWVCEDILAKLFFEWKNY